MNQTENKKNKSIGKYPAKTKKAGLSVKRGSILAYSLIIVTIMITIATSMSIATVIEKKGASSTDFSVQAYQAADSGVQLAVKGINNNLNSKISDIFPTCASGIVSNMTYAGLPTGASYSLSFWDNSSPLSLQIDCNALANTIYFIKSTGIYNGTVRAISVGVSNWVTGPCLNGLNPLQVYKADVSGTPKWKTSETACNGPQCSGGVLVSDNTVDFATEPDNYPARDACKEFGGRLPSTAELSCIHTNKAAYGSFQSLNYWSSDENSIIDADVYSFATGISGVDLKDSNSVYTRCVK